MRSPTTRVRGLLVATVALGLVATATPAAASTITVTQFDRGFSVAVTDCPKAAPAGVACRGFSIEMSSSKSFETAATTQFRVKGFTLLTQGDGNVSSIQVSESAITNGGKLVLGTDAKTASIDITANLVCGVPSCTVSGPHRFKLSLSKHAGSVVQVARATTMIDSPTCDQSSVQLAFRHRSFTGKGTVRVNGATSTIRVYLPATDGNGFQEESEVDKAKIPECSAPVGILASTPWTDPLTGLPSGVTPPQAVSVTQSAAFIGIEAVAHECAASSGIGSPCRVFVLSGEYEREDLVSQQRFQASAYTATNLGGGEFDTPTLIATSAVSSIGRLTVASTMKSGSLSMTVNFTCETEGCAVSGLYTFKISLSRSPGSTIEVRTQSESVAQGDCAETSGGTAGAHTRFKGTGSVKGNGAKRTIRWSTLVEGRVQMGTQRRTRTTGSTPCPDLTTVTPVALGSVAVPAGFAD